MPLENRYPINSINNQMNPIEPNEPAFPTLDRSFIDAHADGKNDHAVVHHTVGGLTKREHLIAMAMQSLISVWQDSLHAEKVARDAVRFADTLIAAMNKNP